MMTTSEILSKLQAGNARFIAQQTEQKGRDLQSLQAAESQQPYATVLSCSDSRIVPEFLFDTGIGELFVIRAAGNVPGSFGTASLEYAIQHLKTPLVLVLSHSNCGAVTAAISDEQYEHELQHLVEAIQSGIHFDENSELELDEAILQNGKSIVEQLRRKTPAISELFTTGEIDIVHAHVDMSTGQVHFFE